MVERRSLPVDVDDLMLAFEDATGETATFLDVQSGEVVHIVGDVQRELETLLDDPLLQRLSEGPAEAPGEGTLTAALERRSTPAWLRDAVLEAWRVEIGLGTRFVRVPPADTRESYHDLEAFIETVSNRRLQDELWATIQGRGAFRRFKYALARYPSERDRWFELRDSRLREWALAWLADLGIQPAARTG